MLLFAARMRPILPLLLLAACTDPLANGLGGGADINGDGKSDGATGIEVLARIKPGNVDVVLSTTLPRQGFVFYAAQDAKVTLEVTHGGTQMGLDTMLKVYGPRLADSSYPKTLAADDDSGYGQLSRINEFHAPFAGFYLVEVTFGPSAVPVDNAKGRLALTCDGACDSPAPIQPIDEGLKWYRRSAERRADTIQAYRLATARLDAKIAGGLPTAWSVVLDIDETTLNNSAYQQSRLDLGVGFTPGSWTAWVNKKAATALDGVVAFTAAVKAAGGTVVLVTNRMAMTECPQTQDNLHAVGVSYDAILCKTTTSDKNPRFQSIEAGTAPGLPALKTILYVGDNIQDFPMLTQAIRTQSDAAFARFGEDFIHVPNPMYGSFDANLDANP